MNIPRIFLIFTCAACSCSVYASTSKNTNPKIAVDDDKVSLRLKVDSSAGGKIILDEEGSTDPIDLGKELKRLARSSSSQDDRLDSSVACTADVASILANVSASILDERYEDGLRAGKELQKKEDEAIEASKLHVSVPIAPAPISYTAAIFPVGGCGSNENTPCDAFYKENSPRLDKTLLTLLVRVPGDGYFNMKGVYQCRYDLGAPSNRKIIVDAMLVQIGKLSSAKVDCTPPLLKLSDALSPVWHATVTLLEGGHEVILLDAKGAKHESPPKVYFATHAPIISGLGDDVKYIGTKLVDNEVAQIKFNVVDMDSNGPTDVVVVGKAGTDNLGFIRSISVTRPTENSQDWIMNIITNQKVPKAQQIAEIIMVATDNHNRTLKKHVDLRILWDVEVKLNSGTDSRLQPARSMSCPSGSVIKSGSIRGTCASTNCPVCGTSCGVSACNGEYRQNGPSGRYCCRQPSITVRCPSDKNMIRAQIRGKCCNRDCGFTGRGGSCHCGQCDTGQDEWWNSHYYCAPSSFTWSGSMTCTYK